MNITTNSGVLELLCKCVSYQVLNITYTNMQKIK